MFHVSSGYCSRMSESDRVQQLARASYDRGDPIGWFDEVYREAAGSAARVPWAAQAANSYLRNWLKQNVPIGGSGNSALVVGAGLGDDAELLAARGCRVTAFDISETAIQWAGSRFADSTVRYCVQDLFDPPPVWRHGFDLVYESCTLQALPFSLRAEAVTRIASFVAPAGILLITTFGREEDEDAGQLPWPLSRSELAAFETAGLNPVSFEDVVDQDTGRRWFVVTYQAPEAR